MENSHMTTLIARAAVLDDSGFIARTRQAVVQAATDVQAEDDETAGHDQRAAWAANVLVDPEGWARRMAIAVANNAQVSTGGANDPADPEDGDGALQYVVNGYVDAFAGV
jgi:hypothetical protein